MKTGAASLSILQGDGFLVENAGSTLGLGWLGALLVLSGSPIAATALTLVAGGEEAVAGTHAFTELQGFTMLTGSRLGAAFVVLVTAVIFAARAPDGERKAPITCAMFALFATAMIYIPAAFLGAGAAPLGHVPLDQPPATRRLRRSRRSRVRRPGRSRRGLFARARLPRRARLPAAGVQADRHGAADARRQHRAVVSRGLADPEVADVLPRLARRPDHDVDLGRADGPGPARRQALREGRQRAARTSSAPTSRRSETRCSPRSRSTRRPRSGSCSPR